MGFWYRAEIRHYSVADEWGDHSHTTTQIEWTKFCVIRETPKGVQLKMVPWSETWPDKWLGSSAEPWCFVLGTATKQYALPTKELALEDCRQRKLAHVRGCKARLKRAEYDLALIEKEQTRAPL